MKIKRSAAGLTRRSFLAMMVATTIAAPSAAPAARLIMGSRSAASTTITPSLTKTLAGTGTAPQGVLFEATSTTTNTDAHDVALGAEFRQITHLWNFGDGSSGTWTLTGDSKNTAAGPVAFHVYEAGTYLVTYMATLGVPWQTSVSTTPTAYTVGTIVYQGGNTYRCAINHTPGTFATDLAASRWTLVQLGLDQTSTTSTVTVAARSAANTICVNGSGTNDGLGPVGCTYAASVPNAAGCNDKDVLMRYGTGPYSIPTLTGSQGARFGAYGNSALAKPTAGTDVQVSTNGTGYTVISDISVAGSGSGMTFTGRILATGANILVLRCDVLSQSDVAIVIGTTTGNAYATLFKIFIVENNITGNGFTDCNYPLFGSGRQVAVMGNVTDVCRYHDLRSGGLDTSVVGQNWFKANINSDGFEPVKIHAGGVNTYPAGAAGTHTTNKMVFSKNTIGAATSRGGWMTAFCPQNDGSQEGVENILVEDNTYILCTTDQYDILWGARYGTARRNTRSGGGSLGIWQGHTAATGFNGPTFGG